MTAEFELEHWRSRAIVAERERDSARSVLAKLRGFIRAHEDGKPTFPEYTKLRAAQREHDSEWWTRDNAMNAVAEFIGEHPDLIEPKGLAPERERLRTLVRGVPATLRTKAELLALIDAASDAAVIVAVRAGAR